MVGVEVEVRGRRMREGWKGRSRMSTSGDGWMHWAGCVIMEAKPYWDFSLNNITGVFSVRMYFHLGNVRRRC